MAGGNGPLKRLRRRLDARLPTSSAGLRRVRFVAGAAAAVALVAVPTFFGLFPSYTLNAAHHGLRVVVMVVWLVVAGVAAYVAAAADEQLQTMVRSEHEALLRAERALLRAEKRATFTEQIRHRLAPGTGGLPQQYELTLYGPPVEGFLFPLYPPATSTGDPSIFAVGAGATGKAWDEDRAVVAVGSEVWDETHGLDPDQSDVFSAYAVVAAAVVRDRYGGKLGVLSALGRHDDLTFDPTGDEPAGIDRLQLVAHQVAWLVPEAGSWMLPVDE